MDASTPHDPLIGAVVGERYRIVSRLGAGGMGAVYRAQHTMMRKELAIKVLRPELGGLDEFVRRFEREADSVSRLAHPNIISVTDFGRTGTGALFLVMELLAGQSLTSAIARGPMPSARALSIIRQILRALHHAHGSGVVHRDLKPDNVMLVELGDETDVVKILDFGIAKVTEPEAGKETLTQAGVIFGTPEYLSPEQALGESVDARADLYAAGVILFEMLTGRRPFDSEDKIKILSMHLSQPPPRPSVVAPRADIAPAFERVVLQALEKSRERRFEDAAAFLQALDDAAHQTPRTVRSHPETVAPRWTWRVLPTAATAVLRRIPQLPRRTRAGIGIGAAGLLVVLIVAVGSGDHRALDAAPPPPTPPAPAVAPALQRIEALLGAGDVNGARAGIEQQMAEHPRDARVRYLAGRLAFLQARPGEGLGAYREAIVLDAGYRGDPVLVSHVRRALEDPRHSEAALGMMINAIGLPARDALAGVANEGYDLDRRQRAADALDRMGEGKLVDKVELLDLGLRKAESCEERKVIVGKLRDTGDARAIPILKGLRRNAVDNFVARLGLGSSNGCLQKELKEALDGLEEAKK